MNFIMVAIPALDLSFALLEMPFHCQRWKETHINEFNVATINILLLRLKISYDLSSLFTEFRRNFSYFQETSIFFMDSKTLDMSHWPTGDTLNYWSFIGSPICKQEGNSLEGWADIQWNIHIHWGYWGCGRPGTVWILKKITTVHCHFKVHNSVFRQLLFTVEMLKGVWKLFSQWSTFVPQKLSLINIYRKVFNKSKKILVGGKLTWTE